MLGLGNKVRHPIGLSMWYLKDMRMANLNDELVKLEEHYYYLESSFVDIVRIIPLENPSSTFSPRLYEILQSTCSQAEAILKIMCRELNLKLDGKSELKPYEALNCDGVIGFQEVVFKQQLNWQPIKPFQCSYRCCSRSKYEHKHLNADNSKMPKWWNAYNNTKHNLPKGLRVGTIENVCLALSGLYILHFMERLRPRNNGGFLKRSSWNTSKAHVVGGSSPHFAERRVVEPRSDIFMPLGILYPSKQKSNPDIG